MLDVCENSTGNQKLQSCHGSDFIFYPISNLIVAFECDRGTIIQISVFCLSTIFLRLTAVLSSKI